GRFWQTRLLADWHAAFAYLPVENMIWQNQANYYQAISQSTKENNSGIFIDFMLEMISNSVQRHTGTVNDTANDTVNAILTLIRGKADISYDELAQKLNLSRRTVSRKIAQLKKNGQIRRVGADKNGYWEVIE
ncbi:MAG: HTH domain-containing protein, partial [Neisseriaceae bacterium]|nr:HTH domain-containing protein [Neisseriaceae bacterium]